MQIARVGPVRACHTERSSD